jgi:hypothetical protein
VVEKYSWLAVARRLMLAYTDVIRRPKRTDAKALRGVENNPANRADQGS